MSYREVQSELSQLKAEGADVRVSLKSNKAALLSELSRLHEQEITAAPTPQTEQEVTEPQSRQEAVEPRREYPWPVIAVMFVLAVALELDRISKPADQYLISLIQWAVDATYTWAYNNTVVRVAEAYRVYVPSLRAAIQY